MIKQFLVSVCLLLSLASFAQEGSYSPYSFYGIGDQRFKGTVENRSMGGLSIFPDSIHINIQNPASFSSLKWTTFTVGGTSTSAKLNTETQSESAQRFTIDYLAVGLPMNKFGFVFGLMPYSSVGYKINTSETLDAGETNLRRFNGTGGVNRVFAGLGYAITKNFRIGADFNYNFGKVETNVIQSVSGVQFGSREINSSDIGGFSMNTGIMYEGKVWKKMRAFGGITYSPEARLTSANERRLSTVQFLNSGGVAVVDDTIIAVRDSRLLLPSKFTIGGGLGQPQKWQVGAEVTFQQSKNQTNRFSVESNYAFENAIRYSVGGYYLPNINSYSSYLARIVYRAGARYENTGLIINNQSIYDTAGTLGFGFPIGGTFSNINIGLEYGKRGTKAYGLVEEKYFNFSVGLSFNDRWFVKRRYD